MGLGCDIELTVNYDKTGINVYTNGIHSLEEILIELNKQADPDIVKSIMPNDYKFIMETEEYGVLFHPGSPQLFECGWTIKLTYQDGMTLLLIENFD